LAAVLALAACSGADAAHNRAAGVFTPVKPGVLTVVTAEIPEAGFWEGTAAAPTGGFESRLAASLARHFGLAQVAVVTVPFADLVSGQLGGADIALSQLTPTAARRKVLHFSEPYLHASPAVLVHSGNRIDNMSAARAARWAVRRQSTLEAYLSGTVRPDHPVVATDTRAESIDALVAGRVDAVLLDLPVATAVASASSGRLVVSGQFPTEDDLAAAMAVHASRSNKDAVDSAVRALVADGTVRRLAHRWLGLSVEGRSSDEVPLIHTPS
jgi:polar amino acid transport system substrate-binding protein